MLTPRPHPHQLIIFRHLEGIKKPAKVKALMRLKFQPAFLAVFALGCLSFAQTAGTLPAAHQFTSDQPPVPPLGIVKGTVVDQSGAVVSAAQVTLTEPGQSAPQLAQSGNDGQFSFSNIPPGPFQLEIIAAGFAPQTASGILHPGEIETVPDVALTVASNVTAVNVGVSTEEIAREQIAAEEKQRIFGIVPNFYVTYNPHAAPLTPGQKFQLAAKTVVDPVTLLVVAGTAGVQQWQGHFLQYGQGVQGCAKRFGAGYADTLTGTFIGGAILPSLLHQDPRYFYKGTGSFRSRFFYAIAFSVVCKGDNGRWQPNYSNVLGSLASGGISNIYYPANDRDGAQLTFENAALGIAATAVGNVFQEFIIKKFTPKVANRNPPPTP
jgi:hypothetical protein